MNFVPPLGSDNVNTVNGCLNVKRKTKWIYNIKMIHTLVRWTMTSTDKLSLPSPPTICNLSIPGIYPSQFSFIFQEMFIAMIYV